MRKYYRILLEATNDLKARGYVHDFNLTPECLELSGSRLQPSLERSTDDEFHRFEGICSTDENSSVFTIPSDEGVKGAFVDAYEMCASNLRGAMIKSLAITRHG